MNPNRSILEGEIYEKAYSQENIEIYNDITKKDGMCAIFFSSAGLYYPNTEDALNKTVLIDNRYEWKKARIPTVKRYIYVRDVSKSFYLFGINKRISTIESIIKELQRITQGYEVICIGSSAGGYLAVLAGCKLKNCKYVLDFSGYYNLNLLDENKWPIIKELQKKANFKEWYDLRAYIKEKQCEVFRFYPVDLDEDSIQTQYVKNYGIKNFPIVSKKHGVPFYKSELYYLLTFDEKKLNRLYNITASRDKISQIRFAWSLDGIKGIKLLIYGIIKEKLIPKIKINGGT